MGGRGEGWVKGGQSPWLHRKHVVHGKRAHVGAQEVDVGIKICCNGASL